MSMGYSYVTDREIDEMRAEASDAILVRANAILVRANDINVRGVGSLVRGESCEAGSRNLLDCSLLSRTNIKIHLKVREQPPDDFGLELG